MFELIITVIIQELGPTGLLILGLYWVIGKYLRSIACGVRVINHNTTKMAATLEEFAKKVNDT